jgi:hypothetical protein
MGLKDSKVLKKALLGHYFLGGFFIILSVINKDIRGFIWLIGALITTMTSMFIMKVLKSKEEKDKDYKNCRKEGFFLTNNDPNSAVSGGIISYTLSYLLIPMIKYNTLNLVVVIGLVVLFMLSGYAKIVTTEPDCNADSIDIFLVGVVGLLCGYLWYKLMVETNNDNMLYYSEFMSDNVVCNKPSKSQYKCRVYKNGELLTSF